MPCSPMRVSRPQGRSWTKPAWAISRAASTSSSAASERPRVTFSRALIENSVGSSNAVATRLRRATSVEVAHVDTVDGDAAAGDVEQPRHERGQGGLAGTGGADEGQRLARRHVEVDVTQHRLVGGVGEGEVDVLEAQVATRDLTCRSPATMSGSVSKISRTRAAAVMASCAMARMTPSDETGHTSESRRVMNATSSPGVRAPRPTPMAPSRSTTTTARLGMTSRKVQNRADSRTLSRLVARSSSAASS